MTQATPLPKPDALLRQRQVLELFPVSAATWWAGIKTGRFPAPVRIGPNSVAWRASDVYALIERCAAESKEARS